ncbi:MAG: hypothetical protein EXS08_16430 [Planctomycetes bacterium]|nr:hypothetical protein [Planctomycetota bacterium]
MSAPGRFTRTAIGLRAVLAAVLAVGAAALAVDVSGWRYARLDLTARQSNTLDPATIDVIDKLPEPVTVDVFLRGLKAPYAGVCFAAQTRLQEFLLVVEGARRGRIELAFHDASDFEATQERQRELATEGTNKVVLSCGARRAELELFGELFLMDWGNPSSEEQVRYLAGQGIPGVVDPRTWRGGTFRPAEIAEFRGEELFTQALLKVSSGEAPKAYFAKGHGEPSLDGIEPSDLSRLKSVLERDGFEVAEWDPLRSPSVPGDCDVLALIGAQQPYQESTRTAVKTWVEAGGRLLGAPHLEDVEHKLAGSTASLLSELGLAVRPGVICQPLVGLGGEKVESDSRCTLLWIDERGLQPSHPLTEPLRLRRRRLQFTSTPSFDGGGYQTDSGLVLPLVTSPADSWRDLAPFDFSCNAAKGERRERYTLVAVKQFGSAKAADGSVSQGRVLGVASAFFFDNQSLDTNRDFALNAFNWLAAREYRISVRALEKTESYLDFARGNAKPILTYTLWLGLPGLCAGIGLLLFLRRRN